MAGPRPILIVLLDGLGDRAHAALGGRSSTEAAATPHLDALAAGGSCGLVWPLGPGRAPSSELAHWAFLGCRPEEHPGRAVLEALGRGLRVAEGEVLAHAALRSAEVRDGAMWVTGRAGPGDAAEAAALLAALEGLPADGAGPRLALTHIGRGEAIVRVAGAGADERVTDSDPFFRERYPVLRPQALAPEGQATARAAAAWTRAAITLLAAHPVNAARLARGAPPLSVPTLKWWGRRRPVPGLRARQGLDGAIAGASPFLAGLAAMLGVRFAEAPGLAAGLDRARALLDAGRDLVLCHTKAIDEAGHTKDPRERVRATEAADRALAGLPSRFPEAVIAVTGDHATPPAPAVIHSGDPVPLIVSGPGVRADRVTRIGELDCADGLLGRLWGSDLLPVLLNAADRPLFLGSRPTAVPGAAGAPRDVEPLELP